MALLQISEPGQAPDPHLRRHAVGIDLGTTHSLVAAVRNGVAECLPDREGRVLLPSVVRYLPQGRREIGTGALESRALDPLNTIVSVKRLMGRGLSDIAHREKLPYRFVEAPGMVRLETADGIKSPVEVSAEILASLRQRAEDTFDDELFGAVITVPAYFDESQRQATKDAARLAGLNVLRLISEPTAAAIAYGLERGAEGLYAIYDLGGGTFDISLLRLSQGVFEVIATGGDSALGGDDLDRMLGDWALDQAGLEAATPHDKAVLARCARSAKERLSSEPAARLEVQLASGMLDVTITRAELERLGAHLIDRTLQAVRQTLRDARVRPADVLGVVMVGGATRMPAVRQAVGGFFGREPLVDVNPDEVVAIGAALQAHQLSGNAAGDELLLLDVIPLSLGIETMGGLVERIIPRNSTIPTARAQDFTTYKDGQTAMALHVVQGERELVSDCRSLARFELRGIPPMAAGAARIRVSFAVDADGLLSVTAREESAGIEAAITVRPSYGLDDDEIARMLTESFSTAEADMRARALRESRVEADRMVAATRSAIAVDGDLLEPRARQDIDRMVAEVIAVAAGDDHHAIDAAVERLARGTEAFAAARMNRGIRRALAGRAVGDL